MLKQNDKTTNLMSQWFHKTIVRSRTVMLMGFSIMLTAGCKKFVEVDPPFTNINANNVFDNDATASAVLTNVFAQLSSQNLTSGTSIPTLYLYGGLAADELRLYAVDNSQYNVYYYNSLNKNVSMGFWSAAYSMIYLANSAIEGLSSNTKITSGVNQQLLGEAKFIRAFCYFYLVNLYGGVPLIISTDPLENATKTRSSATQVYAQIFNDLTEAQQLLSEDFRSGNVLISTSERVRPTKWAASALLARAYLYYADLTKDASYYTKSEASATAVIQATVSGTSLFGLDSLNGVFLKNHKEAIWQLQDVNNTQANTGEGNIFILPDTGPNENTYPVYLSKQVLNSFETGDMRKVKWMGSVIIKDTTKTPVKIDTFYFPYKYKSGALTPDNMITEYEMVLRLGEQYLIRAEARAQLGNTQGAKDDLNAIRIRAGLPATSATSKEELLAAILHERQVELFTEWGHRWLDLKRTGSINNVMTGVALDKGASWNPSFALWPIYLSEIMANPNLVQNPGY